MNTANSSEKSPTNRNVFHTQTLKDLLRKVNTDPEQGLSQQEAQQRLEDHGPNQLKEQEAKSLLQIFIDQIANPIVYLLTAAAILAFTFGDIPEGIAIIVVLVLNAIIGFWMEFQARQSMNALQEMDKVMTNVIRDGDVHEVDAETLVPGDIIQLEAGDLVPADGRIVETAELSIDEAALTGESVPVTKEATSIEKDTPLGDRTNMVFKGTAVTNGKGKVVIVSTGMETEIGSISEMVSDADEDKIPLNRKLEQLTKNLIWATLGLAAAFFCIGWLAGEDIYQLVQTSIAWTIAAIPEGLPIVASIALARGMLRLADHDVIVKRLAAVETLGETTVIFTDKTGTLTENQLTLKKVAFPGLKGNIEWNSDRDDVKVVAEDGNSSLKYDDKRMRKFFEIAILCNDAALEEEKNGQEHNGSGDPLDLSLLQFGNAFNSRHFQQLRNAKRLDEEPFDSDDMVMGTVYEIDGQPMLLCKGAPEAILNRCSSSFTANNTEKFTSDDKEQWMKRNEELSNDGLRVIAFAFAEFDKVPDGDKDVEGDLMHELTFLNLAGFIDPPRESVMDAVDTCLRAGIKVEMVTGDHPGTARNIARQVNIVDRENDNALHGSDLSEDVEEHDQEEVVNTRIFARVDPSQKLDLINYYRNNGDIVAMTGDGINDAPALKKADIGIAMGEKGTQVAQEVSDMVLKNDAFSAIIEAIREGRIIFGNIRKFIMYQLSYHLSEILVIAAISFSVFHLPLLPLQLLFLNLLSDVFPALALGIGKGSNNIMQQKPKDPDEPIISNKNWRMIGLYGTIMTIFVVGAYFFASIYWGLSPEICNNVAFFSLAFAQLWHVFNMREADEPIFSNQVTQNKYVWWAISFCAIVIIGAYLFPQVSSILSFQELQPKVWLLIGITSLLPLFTIQAIKELFQRT
jgi:Ca2+-transporting ATPase